MDEWTSFLEHPLDKDLYVPKKRLSETKPPLRVLVTDAGSKIAYNIIYRICSGNVFGHDQEVIFHLINSRGSRNHKAVISELEECGFACFKDSVVSSNPAIAFKKVDVVIAIATFEEMPGRVVTGALYYQMIKARNLVRNVQDYAHKNCKIIFTGPSTKAISILLGNFTKFVTKIPLENISCVTHLDAVISKAMLAAKLKTTTDKIKNVVIWAATYPDLQNATVRMYPPGDHGDWEMKDVPIAEALQDDAWVYTTFALAIYKRVMNPDLLTFGKAIAESTIHHLKVLFHGSDNFDEICSMSVITPEAKPYGIPSKCGFTFPVKTEEGAWKILNDIPMSVPTHLNLMRTVFNMTNNVNLNSLVKVMSLMLDYEIPQKQIIRVCPKNAVDEIVEERPWISKYFVTPSPAEGVEVIRKETNRTSRKSILWGDEFQPLKYKTEGKKSSIRFSIDASKGTNKHSFISYGTEEIISIYDKISNNNV